MPVRLIIAGPDGSGKTALLVRYLSKRYIESYQSGSDAVYRHLAVVQESVIEVDILDTSACERRGFTGLSACLNWADSFLFVYDVTLLDSPPRMRLFLDLMRSVRGAADRPPVVLVGNKTDLAPYCGHCDKADMEILSSQFRCRHFVTSAAEDPKIIDLIFTGLIAEGHLQAAAQVGDRKSLGRPLAQPLLQRRGEAVAKATGAAAATMTILKEEDVMKLESRSTRAKRREAAAGQPDCQLGPQHASS